MICMSARRRRAGTLNNARRGLLVVLVVVFETQRLSTLRPLAYIEAQGGVGDDFHPFPARNKKENICFLRRLSSKDGFSGPHFVIGHSGEAAPLITSDTFFVPLHIKEGLTGLDVPFSVSFLDNPRLFWHLG